MRMSQLAVAIRGAGGSKGGKQQRAPIEAPDSLISTAYARVIDIISEGECYGYADQSNPLACYYLNETPAANDDGTLNFKNLQVDSRTGTQTQDYLRGFDGVENETLIGVELTHTTAWTRAFSNLSLSAIRVTISTPAMSQVDTSNGDTKGTYVAYKIELSTDGGTFVTKLESGLRGKTGSKYQRSHRIDLPPASTTGWTVRVTRSTAVSASATLQNSTHVDSVTEIIDAKFRMPMTAVNSLIIDAEQFNSIPTRAHHWKGRIIRVPSNYDPETREYDGIWDGTFQVAYSNNPAWVFYDMATNDRYGLGHLITADLIDKWNLYRIAQYCDELVDDGFGGMEPRFTCNMYLQVQGDALRVMQDIASIFRGVMFAASGTIFCEADMPVDPVYLFNQANVIEGKFAYSGTGKKARHTVALVSWNDMNDMCRSKIEYVEDEDGIARYGVQPTEIIATGCTSRGQARRLGKYILAMERFSTQLITFGVGLEGTVPAPGKVIQVADPLRAGRRIGGRVRTATTTHVTVDKIPEVGDGDTLTCILPNGTRQSRAVDGVVGNVIEVTPAYDQAPTADSVWLVETEDLVAQKFRVVSVTDRTGQDEIGFNIVAMRHVDGVYDYVEDGTPIEEPPTIGARNIPPAPTITLTSFERYGHGTAFNVLNADWENLTDATSYEIQWQKDNGPWSASRRKSESNDEWEGAFAGTYRCRAWGINHFGIPGPMGISDDVTVVDAVMPIVDLEIISGVVTIDCRYSQFRLLLDENVTSVVFINAAPQDTLLIELTQGAPGGHTINFGSSVYPVNGVAYVATTTVGAVDILGLTTNNSGVTWAMVAQQPSTGAEGGGGALSITLAPNPASDSVDSDGSSSVAPSVQVTATVESGTAPVTFAWSRADTAGGTNFLIDDSTIADPTFSIAPGVTSYGPVSQTWRCNATDAATLTQQKTVVITLARTAPSVYDDSWDGGYFDVGGIGTSGPSGGGVWITFKRNGTWEARGYQVVNGTSFASTLIASGSWVDGSAADTGDDYEIQFTPSGSGGTISNGAASFAALSASRTIQLTFTRAGAGSMTVTRPVAITIRKIATPSEDIAGSITLEVLGENG